MINELNLFAEKLQSNLQPESEYHQKLVQKGLLLFRQHLVYAKRVSENLITGKVQDVTPVTCVLDLADTLKCKCSCPQDGLCRHQLALFFSAYSEQASVFDWVQNWKSRDSSSRILQTVKRASDLLKPAQTGKRPGVEQWTADFQEAFGELNQQNEYLLDISARRTYQHLIDFLPVEREWRPLYRLFLAYETFKHLNRLCLENAFTRMRPLFRFLQGEAANALQQLSTYSFPFAFDPYLDYLHSDCRWLANERTAYPFETVELYRLLWSRLFKNADWRKQEAERLKEKILHEIETEDKLAVSAALCYIHQAFLTADDDMALRFLEQLSLDGTDVILYMPFWISELKTLQAQNRLHRYIAAVVPMIPGFFQQTGINKNDRISFMRLFFQSIDENSLMEQQPRLLERLFRAFLPYSGYKYEAYLFAKEKYREWVELQQLLGHVPDRLDKEKLNFIAKQAPETVLPLFHEAVSVCIAEKNRMSYKKAVRYLKKLRSLYKKRHLLPQWELFFNSLLQRTKRLRAFHEECRKGKLIHAD
ncbi:SWIM zinc finger family protein [Heyndrickxia acidiproducens]|jgi:hypothetical protein|uniref:SWIM zinc finger family protein n=1 Tax=Heyndrickxia acidiproducens TaxID=1121084 RepID=UPI00037940B7|nr:SWIM zinc finger family protein [Heyndrickxia acidiproducens]